MESAGGFGRALVGVLSGACVVAFTFVLGFHDNRFLFGGRLVEGVIGAGGEHMGYAKAGPRGFLSVPTPRSQYERSAGITEVTRIDPLQRSADRPRWDFGFLAASTGAFGGGPRRSPRLSTG